MLGEEVINRVKPDRDSKCLMREMSEGLSLNPGVRYLGCV